MANVSKAIAAGIGQVTVLSACLGTNSPPWLVATLGVASVLGVYFAPKNRSIAPPTG